MLSAIAGRFPLLHTARIVLRNAKLMTSLRRNGRSVCNFIFARGVPRDAPARVCGPCPRPDSRQLAVSFLHNSQKVLCDFFINFSYAFHLFKL